MRKILQALVFVVTRTSNSLCTSKCTVHFIIVPIRTRTTAVSAKNMALLRFQFSN